MFLRNGHSGYMPVVPEFVLKSTTMTCTCNKAFGFCRNRILSGQFKWTKWFIRNVYTVAITFELSSGSGILQIVLPIVLGHPRSFEPWAIFFFVIISKTFPTQILYIAIKNLYGLAYWI